MIQAHTAQKLLLWIEVGTRMVCGTIAPELVRVLFAVLALADMGIGAASEKQARQAPETKKTTQPAGSAPYVGIDSKPYTSATRHPHLPIPPALCHSARRTRTCFYPKQWLFVSWEATEIFESASNFKEFAERTPKIFLGLVSW